MTDPDHHYLRLLEKKNMGRQYMSPQMVMTMNNNNDNNYNNNDIYYLGSADGKEWSWEDKYEVHHIRQLHCQGHSSTWCYMWAFFGQNLS